MHEIARHTIHIAETLDMSITVLDNLIEEVQRVQQRKLPLSLDVEAGYNGVQSAFRYQKTLLQCSHGRSQALSDRLRNEINLVCLMSNDG
jgi:hypothetical protein